MSKSTNTNGAARFSDAIGASAANEAAEKKKRGRKPKGEQLKMRVDSRDAVHVKAEHELHRPMTDAEWHEQTEMHFRERVELMTLEDEVKRYAAARAPRIKELREKTGKTARELDAHEWLTMTPCIEVHDVNTRTVTVYADVDGQPGAQVLPPRPMRPEEYERAVKTSPFEPPDDTDERIDLDAPVNLDPAGDA